MPARRPRLKSIAAVAALTASLGLGLATVGDTASHAVTATPASPSANATHAATNANAKKVSRDNLLRGRDFTRHGFAKAQVTPWMNDDGANTPDCDGPIPDQSHGYVNSTTNLYEGAQTGASETVVQFRHPADAVHYTKEYRTAVDGCQAMWGVDEWRTTRTQRLQLPHAASANYWVVNENVLGFTVYRTISVVRRGGRVGILTMQSATSHPERTTRVPALMKDMARRL